MQWWQDPKTAAILLGKGSLAAIASRLGRKESAVRLARYRLRKAAGTSSPPRRGRWWHDAATREVLLSDLSVEEMSAKLNRSRKAVVYARSRARSNDGLRGIPWWRCDDIVPLLSSGKPLRVIAERLGRSVQDVIYGRRLLRQNAGMVLPRAGSDRD